MTLMEAQFARDPAIRAACAEADLGLLFVRSGLSRVDVPALLRTFAERSGRAELATAPMVLVGHSAGGPQAQALAAAMPERCLALVQYRGGMPSAEKPIPAGIPSLAMNGQYDEFGKVMRDEGGRENWENYLDGLREFRGLGPDRLASLVVEPGAGHFAWSDRNAALLALFLRKAAAARLPARAGDPLRRLDPEAGWLTGLSRGRGAWARPAAGFDGDAAAMSWHVDEEMARAVVAYHGGLTGRRDQFLDWQDDYWVESGARVFFEDPEWVDGGDTLRVRPVFRDTVPGQYKGRGPVWAGAGDACANSGGPIRVKPVGGPLVAAGPHRLRLAHHALAPAGLKLRCTFVAYSADDGAFRYTERVGMLSKKFEGFQEGRGQRIEFPAPKDMRVGDPPQRLRAVSDADLPVRYYVAYGPAEVVDGALRLRDVPARGTFPVELKVVAYQWGRGVAPPIRTAEPQERVLRVRGPAP